MVHLVHKAFLNHCIAKQSMRPAAIALSALKHPALFPISISEIMASSGSASGAGNFPLPPDTVSRELIDQTNELFVKALKDPSLAEAMVIPATMDVLGTLKSGAGIIPEPAQGLLRTRSTSGTFQTISGRSSVKSSRLSRGRFSTTTGTAGLPVRKAWPPPTMIRQQTAFDGVMDDPHRELHCRRRNGRVWRPSPPDGGGLKSIHICHVTGLIWCAQAEALPMHSFRKRVSSSMRFSRRRSKGSHCQIRPERTSSLIAATPGFGRTVTHKGTFESALREEVAKDPRILGLSFHMSWGQGP